MRNKKINFLKNIFIVGFLSVFLSLAPLETPKAQAFWGEFVQEGFHAVLRTIYDMAQGAMRGMAKQAVAVGFIKSIDMLAGAAFITNWHGYLIEQPKQQTQTYMNDYLSQTTSGRNSFAGYKSEGVFQPGENGNYYSSLVENAKADLDPGIPKVTYEGDPSAMFDDGSFKKLGAYSSGVNNPWGMGVASEKEYNRELAELQLVNQSESIAYQGFKGTGNDGTGVGNVTYPGSLVKENIANVQNIPNMSVASATNVGELVVAAVVSKLMTSSMQQGFGSAQKSNQRNVTDVQNRENAGMDNLMKTSGPGARFGN